MQDVRSHEATLQRQMQAPLTQIQVSVDALAKLDSELRQLFLTVICQSLPCKL